MIFSNRNLKKKILYIRSIIKRIMSLINELILSISVNHKLDQNEYFLQTLNSVKTMLTLIIEGFWQLHRNIEGFSESESEDSLMAKLVLDFVDEYINYRSTFDFNILNVNDPWNILNFSDCFLNYIKNLKHFLTKLQNDHNVTLIFSKIIFKRYGN
ncbi:hypothetical protein NBO_386g0020 [Nosema bombycis CQ1]|uniref:Uncharacterized protein n=1 Tax=Nosema bombycis (strain CQ1 / CVCC 102059) TaxID=578461 RepID=R0MIN6_NOSB1|nr:hypothetical protein NBO_386g0020 [Nosema bombycis CQ1]|eukprot:EOB12663.1 hypothetical protein NBO_386g0020 [Nosema bombycis CQ1]